MLVHICLYFGFKATQTASDIGLNDCVVDKRGKRVHQQHGEHGSFRITVVVGAYKHCYDSDKEAVYVFARICARCALAFTALSLKPLQTANADADKMKQILASVHIAPAKSDIITIVFSVHGSLSGFYDVDGFEGTLLEEVQTGELVAERRLLYLCAKTRSLRQDEADTGVSPYRSRQKRHNN